MLALILLGSAVAIAHHLSNNFLSGKPTADYPQTWVKNLGLAAAFLVKTSLAAAISLAFQETLWKALRSTHTMIYSLDKLFTVQSNPFSFLSLEAFQTASGAMLLAAIQWSIPLAAIFTPGTLNIRISTEKTINTTCHVPTFNNSLGRTWFPGGLGIKVMNTPDLDLWSYQTVIPGRIAFILSSTFCGPNCSYWQTFIAPEITCKRTNDVLNYDIDNNATDPRHCDLSTNAACYLYGSPGIDPEDNRNVSFSITYAESYQTVGPYVLLMNYSRIICTHTHAQRISNALFAFTRLPSQLHTVSKDRS